MKRLKVKLMNIAIEKLSKHIKDKWNKTKEHTETETTINITSTI